MSSAFRIAVFGSRGSGKTIFLACLLDTLANAGNRRLGRQSGKRPSGMFVVAPHSETVEWLQDIKEKLKAGKFPIGTDRTSELAIDFTGAGNTRATFRFRDYRGGDFEKARWKDKDESDKAGVSIVEMLSDCDAVILLLDAPKLHREPDSVELERYVAALSEYERLNPGRAVPVQILYSKKDEAEDIDLKAIARNWAPFRQLVTAYQQHDELYDDGVSSIRADRSGEVARPIRDGDSYFQPSGVLEAFDWMAERVLVRARRSNRARRAVVMAALFLVLALPWGWLASAHGRESAALMRTLEDTSIDDRRVLAAIADYDGRWAGFRGWPLAAWPSFRETRETARAERTRRGEGLRRQGRAAIVQAIAAEPRDGLSRGLPFYRQMLTLADDHMRFFGASDREVLDARDAFDEKVRVLVLEEQVIALDAAKAVVLLDTTLAEGRFPVFLKRLSELRDRMRKDAVWDESYTHLIANLPGTSGSLEMPRLLGAIASIDEWYRAHGTARPGAPRTSSVLAMKRSYQRAVLNRAVETARTQVQGKDTAQQIQIWRAVLQERSGNPFGPETEDGKRWEAQISEIGKIVAELEARLAAERRQQTVQAATADWSAAVRGARELTSPLTYEKRLLLKKALDRVGTDQSAAAHRTEIQQHWERLSFDSVVDEYRTFTRDPTVGTAAGLRKAHAIYAADVAFHGTQESGDEFLRALTRLLAWLESSQAISIHVQQSGPIYVEFETSRTKIDTARGGSASTVNLGPVDPFSPIRITYRYRAGGEPTRVETLHWKPAAPAAPSGRTYRGSSVVLRAETGRPAVPEPVR